MVIRRKSVKALLRTWQHGSLIKCPLPLASHLRLEDKNEDLRSKEGRQRITAVVFKVKHEHVICKLFVKTLSQYTWPLVFNYIPTELPPRPSIELAAELLHWRDSSRRWIRCDRWRSLIFWCYTCVQQDSSSPPGRDAQRSTSLSTSYLTLSESSCRSDNRNCTQT